LLPVGWFELLTDICNKATEWGEFKGKSPTEGIGSFPETKRERFDQTG
jgi:hypothetical protein